jgi:hypothetical protein
MGLNELGLGGVDKPRLRLSKPSCINYPIYMQRAKYTHKDLESLSLTAGGHVSRVPSLESF